MVDLEVVQTQPADALGMEAMAPSVTDAAVPHRNAPMHHGNPVRGVGADIEILDDLAVGG
jgi:hypothetical protein